MTTENEIISLEKDIRFREVGGDGVVLCQERGEVLVVNGLGVRIMELIDKPTSFDAIMKTLLDEYDVAAEELREDLSRYIEDLREAGVLSPRNGP